MSGLTVAVIEDEESERERIADHCSEIGKEIDCEVQISRFGDLRGFLEAFRKQGVRPDVVVVDLRLGAADEDRSGWEAVEAVLKVEVVPVIVYSAYAGEDVPGGFRNVLIVPVTKGSEGLHPVLRKSFLLKLRLKEEKERVNTQFGSLTLETIQRLLGEDPRTAFEELEEHTLAGMAVARLASYLVNVPSRSQGKFLPESAFIVPPLRIEGYTSESLFLGDFLRDKKCDALWVVVAPSCDLVFTKQRKAKVGEVLLLRCFTGWKEAPFLNSEDGEHKRRDALKTRIKNNTVKILRCPRAVFSADTLVVSFKDYITERYDAITEGIKGGSWERLATLASPYAESLQSMFIRDFSRIGTPDTSSRDDEFEWARQFVREASGETR